MVRQLVWQQQNQEDHDQSPLPIAGIPPIETRYLEDVLATVVSTVSAFPTNAHHKLEPRLTGTLQFVSLSNPLTQAVEHDTLYPCTPLFSTYPPDSKPKRAPNVAHNLVILFLDSSRAPLAVQDTVIASSPNRHRAANTRNVWSPDHVTIAYS